jgi:hypothetical protein
MNKKFTTEKEELRLKIEELDDTIDELKVRDCRRSRRSSPNCSTIKANLQDCYKKISELKVYKTAYDEIHAGRILWLVDVFIERKTLRSPSFFSI